MSSTKKSKDAGEHSYKFGDVVLAKLRGYPRWPAMVVDPDSVPQVVKKERPIKKKTTIYCVRFFPAGDFSWVVPGDLSLLQKHDIEAYINKPLEKSEELLCGYKIALDTSSWEEMIAGLRFAAADEPRTDTEVHQISDEGDDDYAEPTKGEASKKRKRENEPKARKEKEFEKASTAVDSRKAAKQKVGQKNGFSSKDTTESADEGADDDAQGEDVPAQSSQRLDTAAKRAHKGGNERNFNHIANDPDAIIAKMCGNELHRAFLTKSVPREEMPEYDRLFKIIEKYEFTKDQLSFSKLDEVMRQIAQLDQTRLLTPNNDQFMIRKRARVLLDKWQGRSPSASLGPTDSSVVDSQRDLGSGKRRGSGERGEITSMAAGNGTFKKRCTGAGVVALNDISDRTGPRGDPSTAYSRAVGEQQAAEQAHTSMLQMEMESPAFMRFYRAVQMMQAEHITDRQKLLIGAYFSRHRKMADLYSMLRPGPQCVWIQEKLPELERKANFTA